MVNERNRCIKCEHGVPFIEVKIKKGKKDKKR